MIAALYLTQKGEKVTILDKSDRLGGRLAYVEHDDFKIDEGPTIVLLPQMIREILAETGIDPSSIQMTQIDPMYSVRFKNGKTLTKWYDPLKQAEEIDNQFPGEGNHFQSYLSDMREKFEKGHEAFLEKEFVNRKSFWTKKNVQTLMKLKAYISVRNEVKKYFSAKELQDSFALQTLYIGGSPEKTPAIYSLVSYSEHEHGIWYIQGGYARLAEVLAAELDKRGVEIILQTEADHIELKGNKAEAVMAGGIKYPCRKVVLNGDFPVAEKLVKKRPEQTYSPSSGCLLIYLGIDGKLDTDDVHQFIMGTDLDDHMSAVFINKRLPEDPSFYVFNPSLIDPQLAPEGKSVVYILIPVPVGAGISEKKYTEFGENMIHTAADRLDAGLKDKIIWKKIKTPKHAEREGLFQGGAFGIAPTLFQSGVFRPQVKPFKYDNIYAVGASVHPGGGVPIVMQGARLLSRLMDREHDDMKQSEKTAGKTGISPG